MEQEIIQTKNESIIEKHSIWKIVLFIIIATLFSGGITYLLQISKINNLTENNQKLEKQNNQLSEEIVDIKATKKILVEQKNILSEENKTFTNTLKECNLDKKEKVVFTDLDLPQIIYPLNYDMSRPSYYNEEETAEINKKVIEPFLVYMEKQEFKVIKINIGAREDKQFRINTIVFCEKYSSFDCYQVLLKKQNGSIPFLTEDDVEPGPGYRG